MSGVEISICVFNICWILPAFYEHQAALISSQLSAFQWRGLTDTLSDCREEPVQDACCHERLKRCGCCAPSRSRSCENDEPEQNRVPPEEGRERHSNDPSRTKHEYVADLGMVHFVFCYVPFSEMCHASVLMHLYVA
jgi:hypothetical protein